MVTTKQAALARARERRLALDAQRDARDRRVEELAAGALLLLEQRAIAEAAVGEANAALRSALRQLLAEGVGVDGAAALLDLDPRDIRRLTRAANPAGDPATSRPTAPDSTPLQVPLDSKRSAAVVR